MVLIESIQASEQAATNSEILLDSGHHIYYVAPFKYSEFEKDTNQSGSMKHFIQRKMTSSSCADECDKWESVADFCQMLDDAIVIENDTKLFEKKRILEIGFCTGVPSVFAFSHGASSIALHCAKRKTLDTYVRSTLRRNNVPRNCSKLSSGDFVNCEQAFSGQKFDVILAPELICVETSEFESIHEILNTALAQNGIILFSARTYYSECSGSLPAFLDFVKLKGVFDAQIRWESDKSDLAPRKIIQMTRAIR